MESPPILQVLPNHLLMELVRVMEVSFRPLLMEWLAFETMDIVRIRGIDQVDPALVLRTGEACKWSLTNNPVP